MIYFADFSKNFILIKNAGSIAVAGVLIQIIDSRQRIISCVGKTLTETEQKWSATEREAFGILFACEKLGYFLKGRQFLLLTDHRSLTFLDTNVFSNSKISRWQERLSEFNFCCQYIEGEKNVFADMFSRPMINVRKSTENIVKKALGEFYSLPDSPIRVYVPSWTLELGKFPHKILLERNEFYSATTLLTAQNNDFCKKCPINELSDIAINQRDDPKLVKLINLIENNVKEEKWNLDLKDEDLRLYNKHKKNLKIDQNTGVLLIKMITDKIILPRSLVPKYLSICHDQIGHYGIERVTHHLRNVFWPGETGDILNNVN